MRVRVDVETDVPSLRWADVHGPARGVVYALLSSWDPAFARSLHDEGWNGQSLRPVGVACPQYKGAPRRHGVYSTSPEGAVWFGSPVPEIATALVEALSAQRYLRWGGARLRVRNVSVDPQSPVGGGTVELSTLTPVIVKDDARFLLPEDAGYGDRLLHNLVHKADVLGLPAPHGLRVLEHGPRRRFMVRGAPRIGARVRVALEAEGRFVRALRSWGLGLETLQGFGWVR